MSTPHIQLAWGHTAGTYYKCDLRRVTGGPATDHRTSWPTCAKFEQGDRP